jgi:hypothetical protein
MFFADGIVEHLNPYTSDDLVQKDFTLDKRINPAHNQILTGIELIYPNHSVEKMLQGSAIARKGTTQVGYTGWTVMIIKDNQRLDMNMIHRYKLSQRSIAVK